MAEGEPTHVAAERSAAAAAALCDTAIPLLRKATDSLGWRHAFREESRDGKVVCYFARALHKYDGSLAMLMIRVTGGSEPSLDLRVTCELADVDVFNAERIVRIDDVAELEVQQWLDKQLEGCLAALLGRVRAR